MKPALVNRQARRLAERIADSPDTARRPARMSMFIVLAHLPAKHAPEMTALDLFLNAFGPSLDGLDAVHRMLAVKAGPGAVGGAGGRDL